MSTQVSPIIVEAVGDRDWRIIDGGDWQGMESPKCMMGADARGLRLTYEEGEFHLYCFSGFALDWQTTFSMSTPPSVISTALAAAEAAVPTAEGLTRFSVTITGTLDEGAEVEWLERAASTAFLQLDEPSVTIYGADGENDDEWEDFTHATRYYVHIAEGRRS